MAAIPKVDIKKYEKKGYVLISEAARRVKRSRTIIDRIVRDGRLEFMVYAGTKFISLKDLKNHYKMTKPKKGRK